MITRPYLDSILTQIGSGTLTDIEFASATSLTNELNQSSYDDLARVLESRDGISTSIVRLTAYYTALGANFTPLTLAELNRSNIFIGAAL